MNLGLNNKVAVVIGVSKGIGKGIALGLAQEGWAFKYMTEKRKCSLILNIMLSIQKIYIMLG